MNIFQYTFNSYFALKSSIPYGHGGARRGGRPAHVAPGESGLTSALTHTRTRGQRQTRAAHERNKLPKRERSVRKTGKLAKCESDSRTESPYRHTIYLCDF
ncbi:hypothetical protein EVAR_87612_1 [Eumeta japonica]|uniref:Uncharacterized protein n=1 Tax=Eumeta variegata TaxID=151549 RepID=A0A4C1WHW7_EUMVA|nr:hypothetical protein EVAR_87612_1 [Eumeta japonica]